MQSHEPHAGFPCNYGKYQLLARIGQGGMAEIFRARLPGVAGFEKILVIKRLLPHLMHQPAMVQMFVNEAKLAAEVQHRNVVQVFELGQLDNGEFFMAMEHIAGTDLRQILRAAAVNSLRIPPWFAVHVVCEVLDGLTCAHSLRDDQGRLRHVVHRDVTPANIFVSYLGDVKLGDFGVAKDETRSERTRIGQLKGKVPYMSPEQLYGKDLDARTDVFAAGVVLWECVTQRRLFGGRADIEAMNLICYGDRKPPSTYVNDVPPELDAIILRALHPEREQRTPSAEALQSQLLEILPRLRPRVYATDVRNIVESVMGNRDPSTTTGPHRKMPPDVTSLLQAFLESTPGPEGEDDPRPLLPKREINTQRVDSDPFVKPDPFKAIDTFDTLDPVPENQRVTKKEVTPTPPVPVPPLRTPSNFFTSTGTYAPPRMPPPIGSTPIIDPPSPWEPPPRDPRASRDSRDPREQTPWPRLPPPISTPASAWATPAVAREHKIERVPLPPLPDTDVLRPSAPELPVITDAFPRDRLKIYEGPHPFWVRTRDAASFGPLSHGDAIKLLRAEAQHHAIEHASISATQQRWMDAATFCVLTGQEMLVDPHADREKELPKSHLSGRLDRVSIVSLFARLSRERISGRLIATNGLSRRELVLIEGKPTFVYANSEDLQIPELLADKKIVSADQIAEILHWVVLEARPIEEVVARRAGHDIARYYASFMKERLLDLFRWTGGFFAVDQSAMISHATPFVGSLLQLVLELVMRTKTPEEIRILVRPYLDVRFERSERFNRCIAEMRMNEAQIQALMPFGGRTLAASLKSSRDEKLALTLAYVLVECDLLFRVI